MRTDLKKALKTSISEVLETMFFLSVEFIDSEGGSAAPPPDSGKGTTAACRLPFNGPLDGTVCLALKQDMLTTMTADFLGQTAEELNEQHCQGTLKELTNMIVGSTFSAFNADLSFNLELPELIDPGAFAGGDEGMEELYIYARTELGIITVLFRFSGSV